MARQIRGNAGCGLVVGVLSGADGFDDLMKAPRVFFQVFMGSFAIFLGLIIKGVCSYGTTGVTVMSVLHLLFTVLPMLSSLTSFASVGT